ncbi:MAG: DMT family transporter [bacterium]|nr:DMT family transporter [bacterium]
MYFSNERKGELFILSEAFLWSLFPIVTILSYASVSALASLAWSTFFSAIFFVLVMGVRGSWHELRKWSAYKDILFGTFILGVCYYLLFFFGLKYTSAGNAALILPTEILFTYLFFRFGRKDTLSKKHTLGAFLMFIGAGIVLYPNLREFHGGDLLIVLASAIAPPGNFFQQRARKSVSSETMLVIRSSVSATVIFVVAYFSGVSTSFTSIQSSLVLLAVNGFLILGLSKFLWVEGIHRLSMTKAISLSNISPLLTLLFAWLILRDAPTAWQLTALIPIFFGIRFLQANEKVIIQNA